MLHRIFEAASPDGGVYRPARRWRFLYLGLGGALIAVQLSSGLYAEDTPFDQPRVSIAPRERRPEVNSAPHGNIRLDVKVVLIPVSVTDSSMATVMLWGMLVMALAYWMYAIAAVLHRVRTIILEREKRADWVRELAAQEKLK